MKIQRLTQNSRLTAAILTAVMTAGCLTGCGGTNDTDAPAAAQTDAAPPETDTTETASSAQESETTQDTDGSEDLTALELSRLMGNGINLGNTMEAYGRPELGINADTSKYETFWGQPVTTEEMIAGMKSCGFDSIRIPVAWTNMMDYENGDYTIADAYLDRVDELITYAINNGMYVIINDHWDGSWWGMFGSATEETRETAFTMYTSMWTQLAERYHDYDESLIFESGNEELGNRLNDTDICKDSGSLSEDECYEMTNRINQTFVDTVRATGGNNADRFLLIAGYNTNIAKTCDDRFKMPKDTIPDKLLVSVHYYDPWNYCGTDSGTQWGTHGEYETQNADLKKMTKFTEQGYGVIIGEYGVLAKDDGTLKDSITAYTENLLDNCDLYNFVPMLWDTSTFFVRSELTFSDDDLLALYTSRSYAAQEKTSEEELAAAATERMDTALANAPEVFDTSIDVSTLDGSIAWIMFNSRDWSVAYSSGDSYKPDDKAAGLVATDAVIDGAGTYTISLDFTGTDAGFAEGTAFSAIGISNAEVLYPGYMIDIKEIEVNGTPYELTGTPYTTSDNGICTRLNLYNEWVTDIPDTARIMGGNAADAAATVVDNETLGQIKTLKITF
ncbi:MAG: glycoside hydrolase family 5 protein, partial [Lachnospiraceae bacterium]